MFFYLSKILWFFVDPGNAFLLLLLIGLVLTLTRFRTLGRSLVVVAVILALIVVFVPIGTWMTRSLENRFAMVDDLPPKVDGIVVLGGVVDAKESRERGMTSIGSAVERITEAAALARQYPKARVIYSGGSGSVSNQEDKEADYVSELFASLGVTAPQLELERDSRNTWENATYVMEMARPKSDETWLLVTSASHMPRSIGVFRRHGWELVPYPVDYVTSADGKSSAPLSFTGGLSRLSAALHEWIGLSAYWLTGKTGSAFPKPLNSEAS